jgi:hypothetical protein
MQPAAEQPEGQIRAWVSHPEESIQTWDSKESLGSVAPQDPEAAKLLPVLSDQRWARSEVRSASKAASLDGQSLSEELVQLLKRAQELDPQCRRVRELKLHRPDQLQTPPTTGKLAWQRGWNSQSWAEDAGLLCRDGRVYVPAQEALKSEILKLFHDCPSAGHWGVRKTLDLLQRFLSWDAVETDVREYVATCPQCQGKAIHRHRPYGKLNPLPAPDSVATEPFKEISLDWITGLPESVQKSSQQGFNAILTIVDRLTKYALFIPTRDDTSAADFAELFFEHVECRFGTPYGVVSDRDSRITSDFWKEVCAYKLLKRRMSTAFHPQTDGQSEALNRVVEDYLRAYTADEPTAWVNLLPLAQYAYNNSRNHTTGRSPNWFMHGFDCEIRLNLAANVPKGRIPAAKERVEKLHELRQELRTKLISAQERMAKYYDRRHVPKQFETGQLVKLSTRHLKLKSPKLAPRWIGPFRVLERIGGQAYRLALPDQYRRLHDVFPVQLLEGYQARNGQEETLPMPELEDPQDEWEVEEVRGSTRINGKRHYLVKWTGWPSEYNSWEPEEHLEGAPAAIRQFEKRKRRRSGRTRDQEDPEDPEEQSRTKKRTRS